MRERRSFLEWLKSLGRRHELTNVQCLYGPPEIFGMPDDTEDDDDNVSAEDEDKG